MKIKCYDNDGKTIDRYTVVYLQTAYNNNLYECRAMSSEPFHPQGFGQMSSAMLGRHLGKIIRFKDLPIDCQKLVKQDLKEGII